MAFTVLLSTLVGIAPQATADPAPGVGQYFPARHRIASDTEIAAGGTATVTVAGVGSLPGSGIGSVALNVSGKGNSATGGLIVYPSGANQPTSVALRYRTATFLHNLVLAKVGADGKIKVANTGSAAVKVNLDVLGYMPDGIGNASGSTYVPLPSAQILTNQSLGRLENHNLTVLGQGGVPSSNVQAVAVNIRATSTSTGALRVHAAGEILPADATIDYSSAAASQNLAVVKLGTDGKINFHNQGLFSARFWVDVVGYFTKNDPDGPTYRGLQPTDLATNISIPAGSTHTLPVSGQAGNPTTGVEAVSLSFNALSTAAGTLRVYPAGSSDPGNETVGFDAGAATTGSTLAKLGTNGQIVLKNTGTAAVTISVASYGYFRKGLTFSQVTAGPSDAQSETGVRVNSTTPTLAAAASSVAADPVTYTFQVAGSESDTPVASGTVANAAAGSPATWTVPTGTLTNPGAYRFRVGAADGIDTIWSPWKRLSIDVPLAPSGLGSDPSDPHGPIISGVVNRPSGGSVTGRFYLFDADGDPLGASPLGEGAVQDGQRVALQIPDELVNPGGTYQWQLEACVQNACGPRSAMTSMTLPAAPAPDPEASAWLTLGADKISVSTAKLGETACSGAPCTLASSPTVKVGGDDMGSLVKLDLGSIPAGARVVTAELQLGDPAESPAGTQKITTHQPQSATTGVTTGAQLNAIAFDAFEEVSPQGAKVDLSAFVPHWLQQPEQNDGILLKRETGSAELTYGQATPLSVRVGYVPATVPGAPASIKVQGGDAGALIGWAEPESTGTAEPVVTQDGEPTQSSPITGYQVEIRDAAGQVLNMIDVDGRSKIVPSLTNGAQYGFRVRAENSQGWGPWSTSTTTTPAAVPNGAASYKSAIEQYRNSKAEISETGDYTATSLLSAFKSLLLTEWDQLLAERILALQENSAQTDSTQQVTESLAMYLPQQNRVVVRAEVNGNLTYTNEVGTAEEIDTVSEIQSVQDYVFEVPDQPSGSPQNPFTLLGSYLAPFFDSGQSDTWVVNAYTADQRNELESTPSGEPPALDDTSQTTGGANTVTAASASGIAAWARNNTKPESRWEYRQDCTNFVSKAISWGGGYRQYRPKFINRVNKTFDRFWFRRKARDNSFTWSAVINHHKHFTSKKRLTWRMTYAEVRVGDIIYFTYNGSKAHMGVVTKKTSNKKSGIFYSHHGSAPHVNKNLSQTAYKPAFAKVNS